MRKLLNKGLVLVVLAAANFCGHFLAKPSIVEDSSMSPTYGAGDVVFVNKLPYLFGNPERNDVVVLNVGSGPLIKRIVATPYEKVEIDNRRLIINGREQVNLYSAFKLPPGKAGPYRLKDGEYFVIGDNRANTVAGPVNKKDIEGHVW